MKHAKHLLALVFLFCVLPVHGQTPTTAADYYNRGNLRAQQSDYDGAISDYTRAIEIDPRNVDAYTNRGNSRATKHDLDGAISDYTNAIEINSRFAPAYYNRGLAREGKNDSDGAIADFTKAIEIDPRYAKAYTHRGFSPVLKTDTAGALSDLNKAIEINPNLAGAYYARGLARNAKGDLVGAIADYRMAIETAPGEASAYDRLAWLLATSSQVEIRDGKNAVAYANKACELTNWQDANLLDTLATAYAEAGNFEEAVRWETKALALPEFSRKPQPLYGLGSQARRRLELFNERKPYHEP